MNGREGWYVASFDPAKDGVRHFRLDRIKTAEVDRRRRSSRGPRSTRPPTSTAGRAPARSRPRKLARVWVSPERARWAREERRVAQELADGAVVIELPFKGTDCLVREVLKEAGDAAVLEPADAREAVRAAVERLRRPPRPLSADEPPRPDQDDRRTRSLAFLDEERIVVCATNGRDGFPHLMPLWYVVRDGELWAWTFAKSQKVTQPRARPARDAAGRGRRGVPASCAA